jgi:hypothetical protein
MAARRGERRRGGEVEGVGSIDGGGGGGEGRWGGWGGGGEGEGGVMVMAG